MCLFKRHVLICLLSCFYLKESVKIMWNLNTNCITWLSATVEELVVGSIFQNANKSRFKVKFIVGRAFVVIVVKARGKKLHFLNSDFKVKDVHFDPLSWLSCLLSQSTRNDFHKIWRNWKRSRTSGILNLEPSFENLAEKNIDVRYINVASSYKRTILRQKQLPSDQEIPC